MKEPSLEKNVHQENQCCEITFDSIHRLWVQCVCGRKLPIWNGFGKIQETWKYPKTCRFCGFKISDTKVKAE